MNQYVPYRTNIANIQYILYLRKSTDDGKHQKLSLPAQDFETREYAKNNGYPIFMTVTDSKSARAPGRPGFNEMLRQIEKGFGFPVGIICWTVDRLSRNPTDEAQVKQLLATGKLADIQFRNFRFENTATGHFLLDIQFAQARYHINSHSEGLKRTIDEKIRRGQYPGAKYFGWRYNPHLRNIEPHQKQAPLVLALYEEFARRKHSLRSAALWFEALCRKHHIVRSSSLCGLNNTLRSITYTGRFLWKGQIHEGTYKPIVPLALFKKVQAILDGNRRPRKLRSKHNFPFCGIFHCSCGGMITAQFAKKRRYVYYRCSKKLGVPCAERYVRAEHLRQQLVTSLSPLTLPANWYPKLQAHIDGLAHEASTRIAARNDELTRELQEVQDRLQKLLDLRLLSRIENEAFDLEQDRLSNRKAALRVALREGSQDTSASWLEPFREVAETLNEATNLDLATDCAQLSKIVQKVGTNHRLSNGFATYTLMSPYDSVASVLAEFANTSKTVAALSTFQTVERSFLCRLIDAVRTSGDGFRDLEVGSSGKAPREKPVAHGITSLPDPSTASDGQAP